MEEIKTTYQAQSTGSHTKYHCIFNLSISPDNNVHFLERFLVVICPPLSLPNGTIYYLKSAIDGGYPLHTVAYFFCHSAYYRSGAFNSICTITGDWNVLPPICNPSK